MGTAAKIDVHFLGSKDVVNVIGMQGIDLRVLGRCQESRLVSLHCFIEKRQAQQQHSRDQYQNVALRQQPILTKTLPT